jgi:hypothetical protein
MFLKITAEESPLPVLYIMHLLIKAAPASSTASLPDPAPGKVMVTVELLAAFSVTTMVPLERVDTDGELAFAGSGLRAGSLL